MRFVLFGRRVLADFEAALAYPRAGSRLTDPRTAANGPLGADAASAALGGLNEPQGAGGASRG